MAQSLGIRTGGLTTQSFSFLAKKHRLSEDEVRDLDKRYKASDLDRSGQLDKQELKHFLKTTVAKSATDAGLSKFVDSQWHNVDRDGSGLVDFDEFLGLYAILKASSKAAAPLGAAAPTAAGAAAAATPAKGAAKDAKTDKKTASGAKLGVEKKKKTKKAKRARTFKPKAELTQQNYVTNEVAWSAIRKHHSFLVNRGGVILSSERGNLRNVHSRYHSGLINNFSLDISPIKGGFQLRRNAPSQKRRNQPARQFVNTKLRAATTRKGAQRLEKHLKGLPRSSLKNAALARISRINESLPGEASTKRAQKTNRAARRGNAAAAASASSTAAAAATTPAAAATPAQ